MTTGIYLLSFRKGRANYIGKSNDISRRWKEHTNKFLLGKAARQLQDAYNKYGMPEFRVILECHEDHIDLMESILIDINWDINLVNTSAPRVPSPLDTEVLLRFKDTYLKISTAEHIRTIESLKDRTERLKQDLKHAEGSLNHLKTSEGYYELYGEIAELECIVRNLKSENTMLVNDKAKLSAELTLEQNKSWWAKLFG
jgi:hypothetical protein